MKFQPATVVLDLCALFGVFFGIYALRSSLIGSVQPFSFYLPLVGISLLLFIVSGALFSLYGASRTLFSLSYLSDFLRTYTVWALCLLLLPFLFKIDYSRSIVFFYIIVSFLVLYLSRFVVAWVIRTGGGDDLEVRSAARGILAMVQVTPDPLSLLENIRMARSSRLMYQLTKRVFDVVAAGSALIVLSPLFPYLIWRIRRDSPGPAFFTQERVGKGGKPFLLYKFRTMYVDAEKYAHAPRVDGDPRVTPLGRLLRRYSLDELPQLINILRGDMSVVGPRPEMPFIVNTYVPWQRARLRVTPGLTGLWQILGRKDLPLEENLEYDLYYVFNQSFFLDCAIVLKTLPHLILPKGAY